MVQPQKTRAPTIRGRTILPVRRLQMQFPKTTDSRRTRCLLPILLFLISTLSAQSYPAIPELKSQDAVFSQYQDEVVAANMAASAGKSASLNIYSYKAEKDDTVLAVAARCAIPYDTLATANGLSESHADIAGKELVLPTVTGIFIPLKPVNSIEI